MRAKTVLGLCLLMGIPISASMGQVVQGKLLTKRAKNMRTDSAVAAKSTITVRLNALEPRDFVNIRPGTQLTASTGTLSKDFEAVPGLDPQRTFPVEQMKAGNPPPDSSLEVTSDAITFARPFSANIVFLDVQVPNHARVRVIVDGKTVLRASLTQPLAFRNQEWGEGALGIPGTVMRAAMPELLTNSAPVEPLYDRSTGSYVVPFSRLQLTRRHPVKGERGQTALVILQIDETGRVVGVRPLTDSAPADLERTVSSWQFEPYVVNGVAVRVTTTLRILVE